MNAQWWLVAPVVLGAALYAAWRLAPGTVRARLRRALGMKAPAPATGECANCRDPRH